MEDLNTLTSKELVVVHNTLADRLGSSALTSWKGKKELLVERVEGMRAEVLRRFPEPMFDDEDEPMARVTVDSETFEALDGHVKAPQGEPIPEEQPAETTEEPSEAPQRTIKAASIEWLCHVEYYEDRAAKPGTTVVEPGHKGARSVGLTYDEVIRRVQAEFPGCNTSVACLRWYAVKIRVGEHGYKDLRLPQRRPRATPKSPK